MDSRIIELLPIYNIYMLYIYPSWKCNQNLLPEAEVLDVFLNRMIYHIFYCVKNSFEHSIDTIYLYLKMR